jgi:hypothetical protein
MVDFNKHKFFMMQILKDIYSDIELANCLGFKGGTALMFFYDLPRFSVDLDFNLIHSEDEGMVYKKLRTILLKYGSIYDEAQKFFGPIIVLDYGVGERKLKIEISKRFTENRYEIKNLLGINMKIMALPDMFAHKLCALLDRSSLTNRDIFDVHFFMKHRIPINKSIVETQMKMPLADYIENCIARLSELSDKGMLNGLGELMDNDTKKFVKTKLRLETIDYLRFYKEFPITV